MNDTYKKQVALLIRIMPSVYRIKDFAVPLFGQSYFVLHQQQSPTLRWGLSFSLVSGLQFCFPKPV
jgi:hypothetical protein